MTLDDESAVVARTQRQAAFRGRTLRAACRSPRWPATKTQTSTERESWAELIRVSFQLDVLACPAVEAGCTTSRSSMHARRRRFLNTSAYPRELRRI
jgi:hypothetical protein